MTPITDQELERYRCILMYDDETVMDAVIALRDAQGLDWWSLVVDMDGKYRVAAFSDLSAKIKQDGKSLLEKKLGDLPGDSLIEVQVVVDQATADSDETKDKAAESASHTAVVLSGGEFKGVLSVGGHRGADLMGGGLVGLAGQYAEIPSKGVLSRRRAAKGKKK
jgi:hypothetical protein